MKELFCFLSFFCPVFFFFLGRAVGRKIGRQVITESILCFCVACIFAPITYLHYPLAVIGMLCAGLFCLQFLLLSKSLFFKTEKEKNPSE